MQMFSNIDNQIDSPGDQIILRASVHVGDQESNQGLCDERAGGCEANETREHGKDGSVDVLKVGGLKTVYKIGTYPVQKRRE